MEIKPRYERRCTRRLVFSYALPVEVNEALLSDLFPHAEVRVQRLSALVEGARDLGRVLAADLEASAALGGDLLIVAFNLAEDGSLPAARIDALTAALNARLRAP